MINSNIMNDTPSSTEPLIPLVHDNCAGRGVREIHIDFLLEEEFNVDPSFLHQFIEAAERNDGPCQVERVKRSVGDQFGEADLTVVYRRSEGDRERVAILIEDKIRAEFQPRQAERYRERGKHGTGKGKEWDRYWTCLVAAESYLEGGGNGFDAVVRLEQIRDWMAASEPKRHEFKVHVINEAIEKAGWTGVQTIDQAMTAFRKCYYSCFEEFFADQRRDVAMKLPAPVWKGETWFRIKSRLLPRGAYINHKSEAGHVDLTFPNTTAALLNAAEPYLEDGMGIEQTNRSAAIRLAVLKIDDFNEFERERPKVEEALARARRLLRFYAREHARLEPVLKSAASVGIL